MRIVYLHGFASSPASSKAQFFLHRFQELGIPMEIPQLDRGDFEHLTITSQLEVVDRAVAGQPAVLMGSSMGGYLAALYASRHPEIERLVLLAPAFHFPSRWKKRYTREQLEQWKARGSAPVFHYGYKEEKELGYGLMEDSLQYEDEPDFGQPALILHGKKDDVVPVKLSERFVSAHANAFLQVFESGHELTDVMEPMWHSTTVFLNLKNHPFPST
jgi:pimeloyl-ACP methyl ester carboxylesterase